MAGKIKSESEVQAEARKVFEVLSAQNSVGGTSAIKFEKVLARYRLSLEEQGVEIKPDNMFDLDLSQIT